MSLLGELDKSAAELYLLRFVLRKTEFNAYYCAYSYAPLVEFADMNWMKLRHRQRSNVYVQPDTALVECLDSTHYNLIQANARALTHLGMIFPPVHSPLPEEARLLLRAGVNLNLWR